MLSYKQDFENNKKWISEKKASHEEFFENLAKGQNPEFLFIGCSDSRVTAEHFMGAEPGDVFVHRNIGNVVSPNDLSLMSVLTYAVEHLKVKHIVVCGHYFCGGVQAAMQDEDFGVLNPWLKNIRYVYRKYDNELSALPTEDQKYRRLIELNVLQQCLNVSKTEVVREARRRSEYPQIHGWIYDLQTGELKDLTEDLSSK